MTLTVLLCLQGVRGICTLGERLCHPPQCLVDNQTAGGPALRSQEVDEHAPVRRLHQVRN